MGCFSFLCQRSGKAVLSTSFSGDAVHLFLLKDGKVTEHMFGNYDSYGRVFNNDGGSFDWKTDWSDVCDLMSSYENDSNGICAILAPYWKDGDAYPTERSEDDPNQGWGDDMELMGDCDENFVKKVENSFHKVF